MAARVESSLTEEHFQCSICLSPAKDPVFPATFCSYFTSWFRASETSQRSCSHFFCKECLENWQNSQIQRAHSVGMTVFSNTCPLCRASFSRIVPSLTTIKKHIAFQSGLSEDEVDKLLKETQPTLQNIYKVLEDNRNWVLEGRKDNCDGRNIPVLYLIDKLGERDKNAAVEKFFREASAIDDLGSLKELLKRKIPAKVIFDPLLNHVVEAYVQRVKINKDLENSLRSIKELAALCEGDERVKNVNFVEDFVRKELDALMKKTSLDDLKKAACFIRLMGAFHVRDVCFNNLALKAFQAGYHSEAINFSLEIMDKTNGQWNDLYRTMYQELIKKNKKPLADSLAFRLPKEISESLKNPGMSISRVFLYCLLALACVWTYMRFQRD